MTLKAHLVTAAWPQSSQDFYFPRIPSFSSHRSRVDIEFNLTAGARTGDNFCQDQYSDRISSNEKLANLKEKPKLICRSTCRLTVSSRLVIIECCQSKSCQDTSLLSYQSKVIDVSLLHFWVLHDFAHFDHHCFVNVILLWFHAMRLLWSRICYILKSIFLNNYYIISIYWRLHCFILSNSNSFYCKRFIQQKQSYLRLKL